MSKDYETLKTWKRLMANIGDATDINRAAVSATLDRAAKELYRLIKRNESGEDDTWEFVEIAQSRGPTLEFEGKMLADAAFDLSGEHGVTIHDEIWQTMGGAYVAVMSRISEDDDDQQRIHAAVIAPDDDEMARRIAVMEFFNWDMRVRKLVFRELKWSFKIEVA